MIPQFIFYLALGSDSTSSVNHMEHSRHRGTTGTRDQQADRLRDQMYEYDDGGQDYALNEIDHLRIENEQLRNKIDDLEQRLIRYIDEQNSMTMQECMGEMFPFFLIILVHSVTLFL